MVQTACIALFFALIASHAQAQEGPWPGELPGEVRIQFGDPEDSGYDRALLPETDRDERLPSPEVLLGHPLGTRPIRHGDLLAALRLWDGFSDRLSVETYGHTHEGRELVTAVIAGERWRGRLGEVRASLRRAAGLDGGGGELPEDLPAVAWLGYGIHGDETSATDAALALVWHWTSARGPQIEQLLESVVLVIDPCLNPDGRERILSQFEELAGHVPSQDHAAMQRGRWPFGRGNHYLFDLNRDWLAGVGPETRARWRTVLSWMPQLFVDGHEMYALDTFLFYPQAPAHNPLLPAHLDRAQGELTADAARAFDRRAWSYYTREWADAWAPFYSDAWGSLNGAVGMLYEMARGGGQPVKRAGGEVVSYRESVHRQIEVSLANVATLERDRALYLERWLAARREPLESADYKKAFYFSPDNEPERLALLLETLFAKDVRVQLLEQAAELPSAHRSLGRGTGPLTLAPGTLVVRADQPQGRILRALLELDPRMPNEYLAEERRELEQKGVSKIYDATSWSAVHSLGLDSAEGPLLDAPTAEITSAAALSEWRAARGLWTPSSAGRVVPLSDGGEPVAYAVEGSLDGAPRFALAAMEAGLVVHHGELSFRGAGRSFGPGSLLLRRHENGPSFDERVERAARAARVEVHALATSRSPDDGPDLGGGHFRLLERPRIALLCNAPTAADGFGALWHHLDRRLGAAVSLVDAMGFSSVDLRRYNVLLVPPLAGDGAAWLKAQESSLLDWMRAGGTLIAVGSAAQAVASSELSLSATRERGEALEQLPVLRAAARRERDAGQGPFDFSGLWNGQMDAAEGGFGAAGEETPKGAEAREQWLRRFAPAGVHLLAGMDPRHWLTAGLGERLSVPFGGDQVLLAQLPVETPVRLAEGPALRLGGLLWPEARERLELSAYTTVESVGAGQVILFAADPVFRGSHLGAARLVSHAVVYGPGLGASPPVPR